MKPFPRPDARLASLTQHARRSRRLCLASLALAALSIVGTSKSLAFDGAWPEPTNTMRPWTRWWWQGSIVKPKDLSTAMEQYKAAGLGGLEITPIYGVRGEEDRFLPYLSPAWIQAFEHTLAEGKRLDLGIDIATGTGWPFGGPWVSPAHASKYLTHTEYFVAPGTRLETPIRLQQSPTIRYAGPLKTPLSELSYPVASNTNLQALGLDQVRYPVELPLVALIACDELGNATNLLPFLRADYTLSWVAPHTQASPWRIFALFQGFHGKQVERAAPGGEGDVIDHFSKEALAAYLARFDSALANSDLSGLRAWFNDSYEVDDANGEANFTPAFLEEFKRRRGYDLLLHLPELFAQESSDSADRVLADYRETISDLLLENYTVPWRLWAKSKGQRIRNQAHGSPANILDLYTASDIPEQEGSDPLAFKLASSAAHFKGTTLASAETGTWLNEHFLGTLAQLRSSVDQFLLGGINHNCYHGTAFSPAGEPWPGFQFYASVELNPANPLWRDFPALNSYVTRAQSFLQAGVPDEQFLLYYNIHDRWALRGSGTMPHFHGKAGEQMDDFRLAASELLDAGYGWDAVSDKMIRSLICRDGLLVAPGGNTYKALVLPHTERMPLATLKHLAQLVRDGATLVVQKQAPTDVPGLGQLEARREAFARLSDELFSPARAAALQGKVLLGPSLASLLANTKALREELPSLGLQFVRRRQKDGPLYFILNESGRPLKRWVRLAASEAFPTCFDPLTGSITRPPAHRSKEGGTEVFLNLPNHSSLIVADLAQPVATATPFWNEGPAQTLQTSTWALSFLEGGPTQPAPQLLQEPVLWSSLKGDAYTNFSGTARYATSFTLPSGPKPHAWKLDLGEVSESARIIINDQVLATVFDRPYSLVIPANALFQNNTLQIEVSSTAANRIAELDRREPQSWKRFYNVNMAANKRENRGPDGLFTAAAWTPRPSGLGGPVLLTPLYESNPVSSE